MSVRKKQSLLFWARAMHAQSCVCIALTRGLQPTVRVGQEAEDNSEKGMTDTTDTTDITHYMTLQIDAIKSTMCIKLLSRTNVAN